MPLKELITVYCEKITKTVNTLTARQTQSFCLVKNVVGRYWNHCRNCTRCCVCESGHFLTATGIHCNHDDIHYDGIPFPLPSQSAHINPLNDELNPICYLLALLVHHFLHVNRIRVKSLTLRLLMSHIYGTPILDVSRSHTTTQHSR